MSRPPAIARGGDANSAYRSIKIFSRAGSPQLTARTAALLLDRRNKGRVMRSWVLKGQRWRENDRLIDKHPVVLRAKILVMPGFARG
jgi:hypothetical protein